MSTAPHVEFSKPLHDVEVKEKESARFECEVSRDNVKVSSASFSLFVQIIKSEKDSSLFNVSEISSRRSAGSKMEVKSERGRSMKLLLKAANTSSSSTSRCLTTRLNMNVMQRPPNPPACLLSSVRINKHMN